ncbi:hypothetical protein CBR_g30815 [Chara braunii]|uniref:DDE Tnp4 domain-containing protein n=1 Tax=Chara braunii TaxID=69332 RepID=A0A388JXH3_CHABU|nr:hypothetical protein CBR_g30815 [Chara braunii]|eukprot:GBG62496.1 hypothetical protein CBR_g30815 [Chara braunii]
MQNQKDPSNKSQQWAIIVWKGGSKKGNTPKEKGGILRTNKRTGSPIKEKGKRPSSPGNDSSSMEEAESSMGGSDSEGKLGDNQSHSDKGERGTHPQPSGVVEGVKERVDGMTARGESGDDGGEEGEEVHLTRKRRDPQEEKKKQNEGAIPLGGMFLLEEEDCEEILIEEGKGEEELEREVMGTGVLEEVRKAESEDSGDEDMLEILREELDIPQETVKPTPGQKDLELALEETQPPPSPPSTSQRRFSEREAFKVYDNVFFDLDVGRREMDVRGGGQGLREEEREAVAMGVTAVVLNSVGDMSSRESQKRSQLRKRRALLQRVVEAPDCVATSEAVLQLCTTLYSGVVPWETPRWWIKRRTCGTWEDLQLCDEATEDYFCDKLLMSRAVFMQIVAVCVNHVKMKVTHYRMSLPVEQVIAFTFYRWASGETFESGTSAFGIRRTTGLQAVDYVTSTLLKAYPESIKWPVGRRRVQILWVFREKGFPNCFDAIDCMHVYIDKPAGAPSDNYYDGKRKFSVQAQVVVDLDLRILDVHVRYPGSVHYVYVLQNSHLWRRAKSGELFDAPPENLPHGVVTRGYLLGDNGYLVACPWIVQPYGGIEQCPDEERFNTRQKVAWGCVERAFGRLKCMWRLFLRTHKTNLETLPQQFVAVCTLHNILLDAGIEFDENLL